MSASAAASTNERQLAMAYGVCRGIARGHFYATGHMPQFARRLIEQGIDMQPKMFEARQLTKDSAIGPLSNLADASRLDEGTIA